MTGTTASRDRHQHGQHEGAKETTSEHLAHAPIRSAWRMRPRAAEVIYRHGLRVSVAIQSGAVSSSHVEASGDT
jgi:hypothetical protein